MTDPEDRQAQPNPPSRAGEVAEEKVRAIAKEFGYAVGVHGSKERDLDLIAVAWTEAAAPQETLVEALVERLPAVLTCPTTKPHGRWGCVLVGHPKQIDLSIIGPDKLTRCEQGIVDAPSEKGRDA